MTFVKVFGGKANCKISRPRGKLLQSKGFWPSIGFTLIAAKAKTS